MEALEIAAVLLAGGSLIAGTAPRAKPSDYPAHVELESAALGADYMVHSFSSGRQSYFTADYLVVEVALYPAKGHELEIGNGQFALRVNRKKQAISPQPPGFIAASLKYPDWTRRPNLTVEAGDGERAVIVGRQPRVNRFPGDPSEQQTRLPRAPGALESERPEAARADVIAVETALPEGPARFPASGFLYFPYTGKAEKIKSLELIYDGPAGETVLKLIP